MNLNELESSHNFESCRRLILGSGRSGTTWILDCLANANNLRPIFEPLHPNESDIGAKYAYAAMSIDDVDAELQRYFIDLAEGRFASRWTDYRVPRGLLIPKPARFTSRQYVGRWINGWRKHLRHRKSLKSASRRKQTLIKCIRANLLAGWLSKRLGFRTVFVLRHPCAAIESQLRAGKTWNPRRVLERYKSNHRLHEITENKYLKLLSANLSEMQALTLRWIIENQWTLEQSQANGIFVVCYEELLDRPEETWSVLCQSLGLQHVPDAKILKRPSQQASGAYISNQQARGSNHPRWQSGLSAEQLEEIQRMLDTVGFTLYDVSHELPVERL